MIEPKNIINWKIVYIGNPKPYRVFFIPKTEEIIFVDAISDLSIDARDVKDNFWLRTSIKNSFFLNKGESVIQLAMDNYPELKTWRMLHNL